LKNPESKSKPRITRIIKYILIRVIRGSLLFLRRTVGFCTRNARSIIQPAVDEFGRIDILVNNAGIIRHQDIDSIPTEDWDLTIKTHLYGMMFCTRAAAAYMKKQNYGRILCTSSHIGLGFPGQASYSTVKEGIVGFARPIAVWRGPGPKVKNPIYEANQPEDMAALATFLVSEAADPINGCIFEVFHGHVGIFVEPAPIEKVIKKDGSWTAEELAIAVPANLTAGRSREVFPFTLPDIFKMPPPK
jgi:hypothetical protein